MSQRPRPSNHRGTKRSSLELHTQALSKGMSALALKTPPPVKRRKVDVLKGQVDLVQSKKFPEHVLVPPPPIHMTGRLKVAIDKTNTHFLVHVIRAKGLPGSSQQNFGTYVTVEITSAKLRRVKSMSTPISGVMNPHFQETFTIKFDEVDYKDRILISLFRQHDVRSDILGCMSFGVKHLLQDTKEVNGWYYLLNEELGVKKHLAAPSKQSKSQTITTKDKKPKRIIKKVITVLQGKQGYGFTILDTSPVRVGKVDAGGLAEQAGLQMGDVLIRINKYHVARSSCSEIIGIVKNAPGHLRIVIERRVKRTAEFGDEGERRPLSSVSANCNFMGDPLLRYCGRSCKSSSTCSSDTYTCSEEDMEVQVFGTLEEARQSAVQQLVTYEGSFVRSMQYGLQDYLKPLRFYLQTSLDYNRLVTALEKMVDICSVHVQQLEVQQVKGYRQPLRCQAIRPPCNVISDIVIGDIYLAKLDELVAVYGTYQSLIRIVEQEVEHKMREQGYWSGDQQLLIRGFLHKPSECLNKLCQLLQMVWMSTPTEHTDHENLKHTLNTLQLIHWWSETVKDGNMRGFNSSHLRQLQEKLIFSKNVKHFRLTDCGRQYVFAGTLYKSITTMLIKSRSCGLSCSVICCC
ncbi:uncharacterized protein [Ptychodera flava]|uniref:uncharacterized protein n=1 Tax=Ptychodera flava TaxID=63121 RepID=UPI00396A93FB